MNNTSGLSNNGQTQLTVEDAYAMAIDHFNTQLYAEAQEVCTAIIQTAPNHVNTINLLGVIAQTFNRHEIAVQQFSKAIQHDDSYALLFYNLGISLHALGQADEAIKALTKATTIQPQYTEALTFLGNVLTEQGRLDEAVVCLHSAIAINTNHIEAYNNLGNALKGQGKFEEAINNYEKAIYLNPEYSIAYNNLGIILYEIDKLEEAAKNYQKAVLHSPEYSTAYNNLGITLHEQGKLDEAVICFNKAISLKPDFAQAYSNLGYVLKDQKKFAEAIVNYEKAISLKPNISTVQDNLKTVKENLISHYITNMGSSNKVNSLDVNQLISKGKTNNSLKLNLLFCPFVDPVTPPSGIASLKGYLNKYGESEVNCIDLNIEFYENIAKFDYNIDVEPIFEAEKIFRSSDDIFSDYTQFKSTSSRLLYTLDDITSTFQYNLCQDNPDLRQQIINYFMPLALNDNPDVIGFSLLMESQLLFSLVLAEEIKKKHPEKIILFGGAATLSLFNQIKSKPFVDFVFMDAGESSLNEFLQSVKAGKLNKTIPGITFKTEGLYVHNKATPSNLNHDAYPDFSDLQLNRYYTNEVVVPILSSKGCFWRRCSFCEEGSINLYSAATVERVVNEIEFHVSKGYRNFQFVDEMISPKRLRMISKEIISRKLIVYFYATLRPSADFSEETMQLMHEAGFRYIIWGVESCSPRVLKLVNKGTTVESIQNTLRFSKDAGIRNHIFIIIGYPSETPDELFATMQFIYDNIENIHLVHSGTFCLIEGTEIFSNPEKFDIGIKQSKSDSNLYMAKHKRGTTGYKAREYFTYYLNSFIEKIADNYAFARFRDHALVYYSKFPIDTSEKRNLKVPKPVRAPTY
ncbi:MAG: tetratricopeptide repeat protein [Magnetococcales bacterium]|nr:tetratricopeptide repeat protein [Magnetococcales bacterium]